jgi:chromosomal replication initiator protein
MDNASKDPWERAQVYLKAKLDEHSYKNWFSQTRFGSFNDGLLVLRVPSRFFARWLQDHYLEAIHDSVKHVLPSLHKVEFVPANDGAIRENRSVLEKLPLATSRRRQNAFPPNAFNIRYTFDRFVVGSGNRFAHAAAMAVAESPARTYNPLFVYGPTGLGKTHLMQAIGQEILTRSPDANVVYMSSENFTNELIEAIAEKSTSKFRAKYRKVDVLLIDDIHFIRRKEATQEEFFHTFNELFDMHKQIVLSSDCGPKEIQGLETRLVSRFEWGLVSDIQPPDMETRVAILQNKARDERTDVPIEVLNYIATCITNNIRELEGALVTAVAYGKLTQKPITVPVAEEVLRDLIGNATLRPITVDTVQRVVAEHFDVRISDLKGRSRERQVAYPRQLAMYMSKQLIPSLSLKEVGEAFGGKHHTTVLYACREVSVHRDQDESTRQLLLKLEKAIRS